MKAKAVFRDMTDLEVSRALALAECRFPSQSFSKRFAATMRSLATTSRQITDRQSARLDVQVYIYRRQIEPREIVPSEPPAGYMTPKARKEAADEFARAAVAIIEDNEFFRAGK